MDKTKVLMILLVVGVIGVGTFLKFQPSIFDEARRTREASPNQGVEGIAGEILTGFVPSMPTVEMAGSDGEAKDMDVFDMFKEVSEINWQEEYVKSETGKEITIPKADAYENYEGRITEITEDHFVFLPNEEGAKEQNIRLADIKLGTFDEKMQTYLSDYLLDKDIAVSYRFTNTATSKAFPAADGYYYVDIYMLGNIRMQEALVEDHFAEYTPTPNNIIMDYVDEEWVARAEDTKPDDEEQETIQLGNMYADTEGNNTEHKVVSSGYGYNYVKSVESNGTLNIVMHNDPNDEYKSSTDTFSIGGMAFAEKYRNADGTLTADCLDYLEDLLWKTDVCVIFGESQMSYSGEYNNYADIYILNEQGKSENVADILIKKGYGVALD